MHLERKLYNNGGGLKIRRKILSILFERDFIDFLNI